MLCVMKSRNFRSAHVENVIFTTFKKKNKKQIYSKPYGWSQPTKCLGPNFYKNPNNFASFVSDDRLRAAKYVKV